jgi:hypothetical protein
VRLSILTLAAAVAASIPAQADDVLMPVIDGEWWQVAGDPDLGAYTTPGQQPVDFGVWQAADGTWQLWSCIRKTACGGHTRLFHRWEGQRLTDPDWKPMGIAMEAKPELGEAAGGLQAPHVVKWKGQYVMAYGDWNRICFATSQDGKHFERVVQPDGRTGVFGEGIGTNTRDPMLIRIGDLWYCYYTALPGGRGYGFCRTSPDLKTWSHSCVVSYGGRVGAERWENECPHVVEPEPGVYYYFRNQYYGRNARNWVYRSTNPLNFGIDNDEGLLRSWHLAAPEVILHEGEYYIASLLDSLKGVKIARLKWIRVPEVGEPVFDLESEEGRAAFRAVDGDLPGVFTTSTRSDFEPPTRHFISTSEIDGRRFDDDRTGTIESTPFVLTEPRYVAFVSGGKDPARLRVALVDAESGKELVALTGEQSNRLTKRALDCRAWKGRQVILRIVDEAKGPWGHISFGGLYVAPKKGPDPFD